MLYRNQFEIDVRICSGKPVIRGTRIPVTAISASSPPVNPSILFERVSQAHWYAITQRY
jgi:hypothetical protein